MDNACYRSYIVRYTRYDEDGGGYTQFHYADFDKKRDAEKLIKKMNKTKAPNEEYTLIDNSY